MGGGIAHECLSLGVRSNLDWKGGDCWEGKDHLSGRARESWAGTPYEVVSLMVDRVIHVVGGKLGFGQVSVGVLGTPGTGPPWVRAVTDGAVKWGAGTFELPRWTMSVPRCSELEARRG